MLRELGLAMVLMLGGDGESARRAGDALVADKAKDAIEEGGFEAVEYGQWDKGFDGRRFWLAFEGVEVKKGGATLAADYAVIFPFSVELRFERGRVEMNDDIEAIDFNGVDVQGNMSPFRRALDVVGYGVVARMGGGRVERHVCILEEDCETPVSIDGDPFERFSVHMDRAGTRARVEFRWNKNGACGQLEIDDVRVSRRSSLAEIGLALVEDQLDGEIVLLSGSCDPPDGVGTDAADGWLDDAAVQHGVWSARDGGIDDLLKVLLVSVPEAYEYLVK